MNVADDPALAALYRLRAEQIRKLKIGAASEGARSRLETVAQYYDRLAERLAGDVPSDT